MLPVRRESRKARTPGRPSRDPQRRSGKRRAVAWGKCLILLRGFGRCRAEDGPCRRPRSRKRPPSLGRLREPCRGFPRCRGFRPRTGTGASAGVSVENLQNGFPITDTGSLPDPKRRTAPRHRARRLLVLVEVANDAGPSANGARENVAVGQPWRHAAVATPPWGRAGSTTLAEKHYVRGIPRPRLGLTMIVAISCLRAELRAVAGSAHATRDDRGGRPTAFSTTAIGRPRHGRSALGLRRPELQPYIFVQNIGCPCGPVGRWMERIAGCRPGGDPKKYGTAQTPRYRNVFA